MSPTSVRVQGASQMTRWTAERNDSALNSPTQLNGNMPVNGQLYDRRAPPHSGYESYDGSAYGSPVSSRPSSDNWTKHPPSTSAPYQKYSYPSAHEQRSLHPIDSKGPHNQDAVGRHLLYETAMLDSRAYEILDMAEVDALKKEHERISSRIDAFNRKLTLEIKVKHAAQNLQRLYSKKGGRPDTPQTPDSPRVSRTSLLGSRVRSGSGNSQSGKTLSQAEEEFAQSVKKVDELNESIKDLLSRREEIERRLLKHTAAVLAEQASRPPDQTTPDLTNGLHDHFDFEGSHAFNEFDGIRDILRGMPADAPASSKDMQRLQEDHDEHLESMQNRLEALSSQLRGIVTESSETHGLSLRPSFARTDDVSADLEATFNSLEESLQSVEQILRQHSQNLDHARDANDGASRAIEAAQSRTVEYETVLSELWDGIQNDNLAPASSANPEESPSTPLKEDFSLEAFRTRVQHLHEAATSSKLQQDILRRQIQQQRELNGKADVEKDREISEWQEKHQQMIESHASIQEELAAARAAQAQAENQANDHHDELAKTMDELAGLNTKIDARAKELETHRDHATKLQQRVQELEAQVVDFDKVHQDKQAAEQAHADLESEVARLRTELTIAQADLDGAYGTRAQRQKEAGMQAEELDKLRDQHDQEARRAKSLEQELQEMTHEFQEITRESLELEKERAQLDGMIDGLRERCDSLEAQLADEKVQHMGTKNGPASSENGRETTSVMVMRQEFKRMMRESRAEGIRLLRAEQEERRKLEAEVRRLRQASRPLGKGLPPLPPAANNVPRPITPTHLAPTAAAGSGGTSPARSNG